MTPPLLTAASPWQNFERRALKVLIRALELLGGKGIDPSWDEFQINERLAKCIQSANFLIVCEDGPEEGIDFLPCYDGHPYPEFDEDDEPSEANRKRPDFSWQWQDVTARTEDEATREFVVECKRLGDTGGSQLNRRYVVQGVARFLEPSHEYGKTAPRGAMVGYLHDERATVLTAVQTHLAKRKIPALESLALDSEIGELSHTFPRSFADEYELLHFWIDIVAA